MSYFRRMLALAALLVVALSVTAQKKFTVYAVGFYNQENLFDTCHDEVTSFCQVARTSGTA